MPDGTRPAYSMLVVALAQSVAAASSPASRLPHYRVEATLSRTAPQIRGTVETTVTNRSTRPLDAVVLVLFANRFAAPDAEVTDVNRPFVYPSLAYIEIATRADRRPGDVQFLFGTRQSF